MTNDELKQRIEELVEADKPAIVAAMQEILRFRTVSGADDKEAQDLCIAELARCMDFLQGQSEAIGLEWKNHENIYAYAHLPGDGGFVGLPLHIDVVPPGEGWSQEPFGGEIVEDVIYGRGCQDDKGPVIQMLYAVKVLKALGIPLKRGARLVIGTAEEAGPWDDVRLYLDQEEAPELCIVSDAAFPIINGEKGILNLRLEGSLPEDDDEPLEGELRFMRAVSGERANIVPPKATLVFEGDAETEGLQQELKRFLKSHPDAKAELRENAQAKSITFHGKNAHGSTPEEGHNAALDMLQFMADSAFVSDDEAEMAEFLHRTGSGLKGENLNINVEHPFIGATTVNLGVLNWTRGSVEVIYNIRNSMGLTVADAVKRAGDVIADFAEETGFEITAAPKSKAMEAIYVDPEKHPEFIGALMESYTAVTDREATLHAMGGTTYSKVFPNAVCFGPVDTQDGEHELAHQADERVSVEHLLRNVKIYAHALARLCGDRA